jgi:hypothetical protein
MDTPPLRLRPRTFIASNNPLVDIVNPCRGSRASLVENLRAHGYAGFASLQLLQISPVGRELSSPPSQYLSDQGPQSVSPPLPWAHGLIDPCAYITAGPSSPAARRGHVGCFCPFSQRILTPLAANCSDVMSCLDMWILSTFDSELALFFFLLFSTRLELLDLCSFTGREPRYLHTFSRLGWGIACASLRSSSAY